MAVANQKSLAIPVLSIGIVSISFASIFIKLCDAPSLVIAVYRLAIASIFYLVVSVVKNEPILFKGLTTHQKLIGVLSGIFLSLHFATWITSLSYTSVASSVVLVQSAPIFVAIGETIFLKRRPSKQMIRGIIIAFVGAIIISVHDFSFGTYSLIGNLLALAGAMAAAGYFLAGRRLRSNMSTLQYVTSVYTVAAIVLFVLVLFWRLPFTGYSSNTYLLLVAIAMIPQVIGHTSLNWALKYFSASSISVVALGEPIGASLLAWILLSEQLDVGKIIGGAVILTGIIFVIRSESGGIAND